MGIVYAGEGDVRGEDDDLQLESQPKRSALDLLEEAKRGKELRPVDHATIDYMPFRKNLYVVPRALSRLTEAEVADRREGLQVGAGRLFNGQCVCVGVCVRGAYFCMYVCMYVCMCVGVSVCVCVCVYVYNMCICL